MEQKLICGLSQTQIEALKAKHFFLFLVTVKDGNDLYHAICIEPTIEHLKASSKIGEADAMNGSMVLFDNCVLECDAMIKNRFPLKAKVISEISKRGTEITATTKNL